LEKGGGAKPLANFKDPENTGRGKENTALSKNVRGSAMCECKIFKLNCKPNTHMYTMQFHFRP